MNRYGWLLRVWFFLGRKGSLLLKRFLFRDTPEGREAPRELWDWRFAESFEGHWIGL